MQLYEKILELEKENRSYTLATVIETSGSVPGKVGFKMLVTEDKAVFGTVGGGEIELTAIQTCLERLKKNESGVEAYTLTSEPKPIKTKKAKQIPMSCEGTLSIYYDVHKTRPAVYIFGGGHVGQALLYMLVPLNYHTVLVDNRPEIANRKTHPNATEIVLSDYLEYARSFEPESMCFIVILTQGHHYDYDILKEIYRRSLPVKYIGIIGSQAKAYSMLMNLKKDFGESIDLTPVSTPIGLKIGGNTAAEIALSIAAEIQSVRFDKMLIPE